MKIYISLNVYYIFNKLFTSVCFNWHILTRVPSTLFNNSIYYFSIYKIKNLSNLTFVK